MAQAFLDKKMIEDPNNSSLAVQPSDNESVSSSSSGSDSDSSSSSGSDSDDSVVNQGGSVSDEEANAEADTNAAEAVNPAEDAEEKAQAEAEKNAEDKAKAEKLAEDKAKAEKLAEDKAKAEKLAEDKARDKAEKLAAKQIVKEKYEAKLKKLVSARQKKIRKFMKGKFKDVHRDTKTNRNTFGFFPRVDLAKAIHSIVKFLETRLFKDITDEDLMPHIQCLVNPSTRNEKFTRHIAVALLTLKRSKEMFEHPTLLPLVLIFMPQIILLLGNADAEHKVAHWTDKAPRTLPLTQAQSCGWWMRDFCEQHSQTGQKLILCQRILEKMKTEGLLPEMKTATKKRDRDVDPQQDTANKKVKTAEEEDTNESGDNST